jgi:hypothetical protein
MVVGVRELILFNDRLRYSPVPPERVPFCSRNGCKDLRRKCLSELVYRERDCIIGHGTTKFLKERLGDQSDPFVATVCNQCGNFATKPNYCKVCDTNQISKVNLPYISKLVMQELNAMLIKCGISI